MKPYSKKFICDTETPVSLFHKITKDEPYAFLLESAESHERFGRYSFIGFDPMYLYEFSAKKSKDSNPFKILRKKFESISYMHDPSLPRLQAGFIGYFNYETIRHLEKLNLPADSSTIPESVFYFPKNLIIFDHFAHTATLIAYDPSSLKKLTERYQKALSKSASFASIAISPPVTEMPNINSESFESLIEKAKEDIRAGEVFQIVLSKKFEQQTEMHPFDIYRALRMRAPSPYMYYLKYPDFSIIGSSPETLVRTEKDEIIVRPIAGTRRRGRNETEDCIMAEELLRDTKEQAEHMMLVDLGRNDVGRVAEPGSVRVTQLMELEKFSHVMHLVSEVRGRRGKNTSLFDIFAAAFPAGTLTGAPKIRAMEIIATLEKQPRGIYGGAVGYFDLSGNMDFAIAIRTMVYQKGRSSNPGKITMRAGAGIVYDSIPAQENLECRNKARGPLSAVS